MGRLWQTPVLGNESALDIGNAAQERVLGLRADISDDGEFASFVTHFTNQNPFRVRVGVTEIAPILNTVQTASSMMVARQRVTLNQSEQRLLEICQNAARPIHYDVLIDPTTGDRLFIYRFENTAPLAIRMSPADVHVAQWRLSRAVARSLN